MNLTTKELRRQISRHLGLRNLSTITTDESDAIDDSIRQGLRWFYFGDDYVWSFLRAYTTLKFTPDAADQNLPEDFVRVDSIVTFTGGKFPLEHVSSETLQASRQNENRSGTPVRYAIQTRPPNQDTLYRMGIYPLDGETTVHFWYQFSPSFPTDGIPPRGGASHADTIIAACIAAAESIVNPEGDRVVPTMEKYLAYRAESIKKDSLLKGPSQ